MPLKGASNLPEMRLTRQTGDADAARRHSCRRLLTAGYATMAIFDRPSEIGSSHHHFPLPRLGLIGFTTSLSSAKELLVSSDLVASVARSPVSPREIITGSADAFDATGIDRRSHLRKRNFETTLVRVTRVAFQRGQPFSNRCQSSPAW